MSHDEHGGNATEYGHAKQRPPVAHRCISVDRQAPGRLFRVVRVRRQLVR
jgi:hypothetical protein